MQTKLNRLAALVQAVAFAADKHRNQRRKDAEASPYINHPNALGNVLAKEVGVKDLTVWLIALKVVHYASHLRIKPKTGQGAGNGSHRNAIA